MGSVMGVVLYSKSGVAGWWHVHDAWWVGALHEEHVSVCPGLSTSEKLKWGHINNDRQGE